MKNNKRGFTLIEVLVVVLIIGILAAVAVPQYQKAVVRAELSTYQALATSIIKSAHIFFLENGNWPFSLEQLDVQLPGNMSVVNYTANHSCASNESYFCCLDRPVVDDRMGKVFCGNKDNSLLFVAWYADDKGVPVRMSQFCYQLEEKKQCPGVLFNRNQQISIFNKLKTYAVMYRMN